VIDENVMIPQVEDLLSHILAKDEPLHCFVGHSTGGVVAIQCARKLTSRKIHRLGLVSPALWANKPLVARLADRVPAFIYGLLKKGFKPIVFAVKDAYTKNCHIAFASEKNKCKKYFHDAAFRKALAGNVALFKHHPTATSGICSISNFYLNGALLPMWRQYLTELGSTDTKTLVVYGDRDVVVPNLASLASTQNVECATLTDQGHESLYENTATISPKIIEFLFSLLNTLHSSVTHNQLINNNVALLFFAFNSPL